MTVIAPVVDPDSPDYDEVSALAEALRRSLILEDPPVAEDAQGASTGAQGAEATPTEATSERGVR